MMVLYNSVEDNYYEYLLYTKLHEIKLERIYYPTIQKAIKSLELYKRY